MKKLMFFLLGLLLISPGWAVDYDLLDSLLAKYTAETEVASIRTVAVDYPGLKNESSFSELISQFERTDTSELDSESAELAFWINAYNVFAIKLVLDHYPVTSIRDVGDVFHPFNQRTVATIAGSSYSLDDIKHLVLRRRFEQPLIHTALCSASLSGPDLRRVAYRGQGITAQLQEQLTAFLGNPQKGFLLDQENRTLYLASFFTWDAEDFKKWGGIINFIAEFISAEARDFLNTNRYKVKYFDYNWDLNQIKH